MACYGEWETKLFVVFYVLLFELLARSTINLDVGLYLCNVKIMDFWPVKHSWVYYKMKYICKCLCALSLWQWQILREHFFFSRADEQMFFNGSIFICFISNCSEWLRGSGNPSLLWFFCLFVCFYCLRSVEVDTYLYRRSCSSLSFCYEKKN